MGYRPTAFISYRCTAPDAEIARVLRDALKKNEVFVPTWRDREDLEPGDDFVRKIEDAIDAAEYFVFVLSPRSAESSWCRRELTRAVRQEKTILPALIEDTTHLPLHLEGSHFCDLRRGVKVGLPSLLQRMRILPADKEVDPDPLSRDELRIEAFAQACLHLGRGIGLEDSRLGLLEMLKSLGVSCVETPKARDVVSTLRNRNWRSLAEAGEYLLAAWRGQV